MKYRGQTSGYSDRKLLSPKADHTLAERGQGLIEYVIVIGLIAGVVAAALALTGVSIGELFEQARLALLGIGESADWSDPPQDIAVSVVDASETGIANVRVFAFDDQGNYLGHFEHTDRDGVARFGYPQGVYRFLVRYQLKWFWSDTVVRPQQSQAVIRTGQRPFAVTVQGAGGAPMPALTVYAYSDDEQYVGVNSQTNADGLATMYLVDGDFKFRVDYREKVYWSDVVPSSSGGTTIIINSCPADQFLAEYYNNRSLSGEPVLTRCESHIANDWSTGSPGDPVGRDTFSVRWTGSFHIPAGTYTFIARADDGVRVWVDDDQIIDAWQIQPATTYRRMYSLSGGEHEIKMEYFENHGHAIAELQWQPVIDSCPDNQYLAEYFNNYSLSGEPDLVRCENQINYDWRGDGPADGIHNNNFSVRWTGSFHIPAGTYTFVAEADDGMQVWVDGVLIIDAWRDQRATEYRSTYTLQGDEHNISVQYYERGGMAVARLRWE
ncbi:MAG: hypothetical protein Kow0063_25670 [Anaerolineae bacterium]